MTAARGFVLLAGWLLGVLHAEQIRSEYDVGRVGKILNAGGASQAKAVREADA